MPGAQIDPVRLSGEALRQWYLRTPEEIEQEREASALRRHTDFFGRRKWRNPDPGFAIPAPERNVADSIPRDSRRFSAGSPLVPRSGSILTPYLATRSTAHR